MKDKFYQFMQGRYGSDQLNSFLIIISIICFIINIFISNIVIEIVFLVIWY